MGETKTSPFKNTFHNGSPFPSRHHKYPSSETMSKFSELPPIPIDILVPIFFSQITFPVKDSYFFIVPSLVAATKNSSKATKLKSAPL